MRSNLINKLFFFILENLPKSSRIPALKKYDMMTFHIVLFQINYELYSTRGK
jgi:hypothetical protein